MIYLRKLAQRFHRNHWGTSTFELAVVQPVLFVIGLSIFEFGYLIYNYLLISIRVRDGARYAAGFLADSADTVVKSNAMTGVTSGGTYPVSWWNNPTMVTITYQMVVHTVVNGFKSYRGRDNITMVTVSTDVPYQALGFLGYLGLGSITLHAQHQERLYGVR